MSEFKNFIINEQKNYLTEKIGDILSATQELDDDAKNMGSRDLSRFTEKIVNQIRRVLHSNWSKENKKYLINLQKVGVSLMKSIKEKGELEKNIAGARVSLEKIISDLGLPVNKIISPDEKKPEDVETVSPPETSKNNVQPKSIEKIDQSGAPVNKDPELIDNVPLAGNSGAPLSAL